MIQWFQGDTMEYRIVTRASGDVPTGHAFTAAEMRLTLADQCRILPGIPGEFGDGQGPAPGWGFTFDDASLGGIPAGIHAYSLRVRHSTGWLTLKHDLMLEILEGC